MNAHCIAVETNIVEVTHKEFIQTSLEILKRQPKIAIGIFGQPGIGKSDLIRKLALELGAELRIYIAARRNPNTTTGIPQVGENGFAKWVPFLEFNFDEKKKYVLHFDELTNAPPIIQSCLLGVLLDRQLEELHIPDNVYITAAGNLSEHSRASFDLIEPMPSRLALFYLKPPIVYDTKGDDDWLSWATENKVSPYITAFLSQNTTFLSPKPEGIIYPTPRGWARAGQLISDDMSIDKMERIVAAFVGAAAAKQFSIWLKIKDMLPTLEGAFYLKDSKWLNVISSKNALMEGGLGIIIYVISSLVGSSLITNDFTQSLAFIEALPAEFQIIAFRTFRQNSKWFGIFNKQGINWAQKTLFNKVVNVGTKTKR